MASFEADSSKVNAIGPTRLAFGLFEADLQAGELWKSGRRIKLQGQPFKVLCVLLEHAGQVVTREELELQIWGTEVVVDFDHAVGSAIKKVRQALGDSATNPRFIETLNRRGFRFIAPVQAVNGLPTMEVNGGPQNPGESADDPADGVDSPRDLMRTRPLRIYAWIVLAFILGVSVAWLAVTIKGRQSSPEAPPRIARVTREGMIHIAEGADGRGFPAVAIDGDRLFISTLDDRKAEIRQIYIPSGENRQLSLPSEIGEPEICDISRDGTRLLVRSYSATVPLEPLWVVPVDGGAPYRIAGVVAQDATWMPDGKSLMFAAGNRLAIVSLDGTVRSDFAVLPDEAHWLRWSTDGRLLRFTMRSASKDRTTLWEIEASSRSMRAVLPDWPSDSDTCCGIWTPDGRHFVFQAARNGHDDLWMVRADGKSSPMMLTHGPLNFGAPARGMDGGRIFFVGGDWKSESLELGSSQHIPKASPAFLASSRFVAFSNDGKWVAWIDASGKLWRARADGNDQYPITPESLQVGFADWAPDASQILFSARRAGEPWRIFAISAAGGELRNAIDANSPGEEPSYAPDGKRFVFSRGKEGSGLSRLQIVDLANHHVEEIEGSNGMTRPRWSPKGDFIGARTLKGELALYSPASRKWEIQTHVQVMELFWSPDGEWIYLQSGIENARRIYRFSVHRKTAEEVTLDQVPPVLYKMSGIGPSGALYLSSDAFMAGVYTADLNSK